jgi:hypothetical protein
MSNNGFSVKRDRELEKAGGFWCQACLVSHPATEQSPDPRYCEGCYGFLLKEAEMLPVNKRPKWVPEPAHPKSQRPAVAARTHTRKGNIQLALPM